MFTRYYARLCYAYEAATFTLLMLAATLYDAAVCRRPLYAAVIRLLLR